MMTQVLALRLACLLGGLAVAIGAFGAHGLRGKVDASLLEIYETGVKYHFYHALALLAVAVAVPSLWQSRLTPWACVAWVVGILIFSGSLYTLTLTGQRWLGAITPIGGVAFILGWALMAAAAGSIRQ
jgi:uncharacterized membrane protein YgdD (TMEM256/DUF423 family)